MAKRILIVQGHPDGDNRHLLHAMADAYAEAAIDAGHTVRRIEIAKIDFPLLRRPADFETGALPASLDNARQDLKWSEHWVIFFPLWLGTMPALLKGFLEQLFRPGFAMERVEGRFPKKLLKGRSARLVVTMGMPAFLFRWVYGAHGVRGMERSILGLAGIKPIQRTLIGPVPTDERKAALVIAKMRGLGRAGA